MNIKRRGNSSRNCRRSPITALRATLLSISNGSNVRRRRIVLNGNVAHHYSSKVHGRVPRLRSALVEDLNVLTSVEGSWQPNRDYFILNHTSSKLVLRGERWRERVGNI